MVAPEAASEASSLANAPERYAIRRLEPKHKEWVKAVACHAQVFHSPLWSVCYPQDQSSRFLSMMDAADYLVEHQIRSGMSFGAFDLQYEFKRPESAATGGAIYLEELQSGEQFSSQECLERMDIPLVSVALAYDQADPKDMMRMKPLVQLLPLFATFGRAMSQHDTRDGSWKADQPRQVLMRNATATRADSSGNGLMRKLAHAMMRDAKGQGYRGIEIDCMHNSVTKVWLHPPPPFRGELVAQMDVTKYEERDAADRVLLPFALSKQVCSKVHVHL